MRRAARRLTVVVALVTSLLASRATVAATLEGPITSPGSAFLVSTTFDPGEVGYMQEEYFLSGTASAYTSAGGAFTSDGAWTAARGETADYKTRIVVYRPTNPRNFNGTVVVEWLNVSGGLDAPPDWTQAHTGLIREGFAWVGVSAQKVGVDGGPALVGVVSLPLKTVNPARYGSLVHPGDSFSYDIFSQAGQVVRRPAGTGPLGPLKVKHVIGVGESQSAFRLVTYVNAVDPLEKAYDGFLIYSRSAGGAPLSEAPQAAVAVPSPARIRGDVRVPVLTFQTETDLLFLQYVAARQDDGDRFRLWEVAGTAHYDAYGLVVAATDRGDSPSAADLVVTTQPIPGLITCGRPVNSGQQHFVLNAAFHALNRWVKSGRPPRPAPRLEITPGPPADIARDADGNALGGIRTPSVDAPIAALRGDGQQGSVLCLLFGSTVPFDADRLGTLYPSHRAYVSAVRMAAQRGVRRGFLLRPDAKLIRASAEASAIGN